MSNTYRITKISEAFAKIPEDRIDAFVTDLGNAMKSYHAVQELAQSPSKVLDEFYWVDDGEHHLKICISPPDSELPKMRDLFGLFKDSPIDLNKGFDEK